MNHRDAWCEERRAPTEAAANLAAANVATSVSAGEPEARRRIVPTSAPTSANTEDVLIVASRLKQYIDERAGMNTAGDVMDALSEIVREKTDAAILRARADGRKTVKGRDFS